MYQFLIQDAQGEILYTTPDKHHAKAMADVLQMRLGKPIFVDCMLTTNSGLCDYTPISQPINVPDRKDEPCRHL